MSQFTLPAIEHDGKTIMDSLACAKYLEATFLGTPSLFPNEHSVVLARLLQYHIGKNVDWPLFPYYLPRIVALLDDKGAEYFRRTREEDFGFKISDSVYDDKEKLEAAWKETQGPLKVINNC